MPEPVTEWKADVNRRVLDRVRKVDNYGQMNNILTESVCSSPTLSHVNTVYINKSYCSKATLNTDPTIQSSNTTNSDPSYRAGRSIPGIGGSNPTEGSDIFLLYLLRVM
jgi:septal ring-binding cell division protein DamX